MLHIRRTGLYAEPNAPVAVKSGIVRIFLKVRDIFVKNKEFVATEIAAGHLQSDPWCGFVKEAGPIFPEFLCPIETMSLRAHGFF